MILTKTTIRLVWCCMFLLGAMGLTNSATASSAYCNTQVYHLGIPAETASSVFVTIENIDANTIQVSVESADADPVDDLIIPGAAGGVQSGLTINAGVASKTIFWDTPPTTVSLNVLWSKASFGGNWQLNPTDFDIDFADTCVSVPAGAELSDITVDGTTVSGFSSGVVGYSVELPFGTSMVPTVDATTQDP
ncbi:MAG: hypothetical protein HRT74_11970, partial [Flavobacteriales bacterium]|nr:hypothetical protein [Flavobacteriales bacterium]